MIFVTKVINITYSVDVKIWNIKISANEDIWTFHIKKHDIYEKFLHVSADRWHKNIQPFLVIKTDENFNILKGIFLTPLEIEGIDLKEMLDSV